MKKEVFSLKSVSSELKKAGFFLIGIMVFMIMLTGSGRVNAQGAGNEELDDLMKNMHPSIYLINGEYSTYGYGAPEVLFCDVQSLQLLNNSNTDFNTIRLIKVKVKDGQSLSSLILASLTDFQSLKYFAVVYEFDVCGDMSSGCLDALAGESINTEGTNVSLVTFLQVPN
jgi:hypothetical protein